MYVTTSSYMSSYKMAPVAAVLSYSDNRNFRKVSAQLAQARRLLLFVDGEDIHHQLVLLLYLLPQRPLTVTFIVSTE